jgi:hypothetical protein
MEEAMKNARCAIGSTSIYVNLTNIERVPPIEYGKHCRDICVEEQLVMMSDAFPYDFAIRRGQK